MDALAAEGIIFDKGYVASPVCAASRAAVMTGLYPQQNGVAFLDKRAFTTYYSGEIKGHPQKYTNNVDARGK